MKDVHWGFINLAASVVFLVLGITLNFGDAAAIPPIPNLVLSVFCFGRASV